MSLPRGYDAWKTASPYDEEMPCEVCGLDSAVCECPECPVCSEHGNPKCEINAYKPGGPIRRLSELASAIGCDESRIGKSLFRSTECGIWFKELHNKSEDYGFTKYYVGVSVCGYSEGADAECVAIELVYPFTPDEFWAAVKQADDEGCQLWHDWQDADHEKISEETEL